MTDAERLIGIVSPAAVSKTTSMSVTWPLASGRPTRSTRETVDETSSPDANRWSTGLPTAASSG